MKRSFLTFFLLVFGLGPVFSADEVFQKIGLSIDPKSPGYKIELILQKVILSSAASNARVNIYSADKADLEYTGISELNGKVLLKAVKKAGYYQMELYQADSEKTNILFSDTVKLYLKQFGDTVDDVARQIVSNIAVKYPPKPIRELTSINIVRVKLSEYESQNGYWSLSVIPAFDTLNSRVELLDAAGSWNYYKKQFNNMGGSLNVEGFYRIQQWNFSIGGAASFGGWNEQASSFKASYNDFYLYGMVGYGIFGSLIVIGIEPNYFYSQWNNDYEFTISNNVISAPDVSMQIVQFNIYLQINISKDYYIVISGGPNISADFFYDTWLDFGKNGKYPYLSKIKLPSQYVRGMPLVKLRFNFRLFNSWNMQLLYDTLGPSFNGDSGATDDLAKPRPVMPAANVFLYNFSAYGTRIGLGVSYAF